MTITQGILIPCVAKFCGVAVENNATLHSVGIVQFHISCFGLYIEPLGAFLVGEACH